MSPGTSLRSRMTGNLTDSHVSHWGKPTGIRSVQSFTIDLTGATTATATINAVDTGNSFVVFLGSTSAVAGAVNRDIGRLALTNSTTVTATQDVGHNANPLMSGMVIECWPGLLKSVQQGTVTLAAAASGTATIAAVTVAKTLLLYEGFSGPIGDLTPHAQATVFAQLTNTTTVTLTAGDVTSMTGAFTAVEFY